MLKRLAALVVVLVSVLAISGCSAETRQETNQALEETGEAIDSAAEDAADATEGALEGAAEAVEDDSLEPVGTSE